MHTEDIRAFVAVVEARSVSRAARDLHLTQPAVTRRVQRLEQVIGAALIDRHRRPFTLTEVGQVAVESCRRVLSATGELRALSQTGAVPSREIRIGVAHALTELVLTEPLETMRNDFPKIVLRLHTGWSRDLLERVRNGSLDAALILLPEGESVPGTLNARPLAVEHLAVVAPRRWQSRVHTVRDFDGLGWILNPEGCGGRAQLQKELGRARLPLRVSVETYSYDLQMSLVARSQGIGLVPERLLRRSPLRSQLCRLRIRGFELPFTIWMTTGQLMPPLERPLNALAELLGQQLAASAPHRRTRSRPTPRVRPRVRTHTPSTG